MPTTTARRHNAKEKIRPRHIKGGEAPKGASNQFRAAPTNVAACRCPGAEARPTQTSVRSLRTYLLAGRARLPALRGGSRQDFPILAQLQAMVPGTRFRRALPALSCPTPVEAPHASAVVPKRMMPKAAPAQVASLRGSTALAPHFGSHPEGDYPGLDRSHQAWQYSPTLRFKG